MRHISPRDGDGWGAAPPDEPPAQHVVQQQASAGGNRVALLAAIGVVVVLALVAIVMVVGGDGDGNGGGGGGDAAGSALGSATPLTTTVPSNQGTVAPTTTEGGDPGGGSSAGADLPPVTIPAESSPPTTIPGSEPNSVPADIMTGEEAPQFGTLVVDLEEGGYLDFAVHLRSDQEIQVLSLADDGIETAIEVFAPDGSSEGTWQGGEPGVVNGLEWYLPDEPLPATGTYVIRVIHTGGSHDPFALGFFGNA